MVLATAHSSVLNFLDLSTIFDTMIWCHLQNLVGPIIAHIVFHTTAIQMTQSCSFHFPQINLGQDLGLSLIISAWMQDHIHDVNSWSQECWLMIYCFFPEHVSSASRSWNVVFFNIRKKNNLFLTQHATQLLGQAMVIFCIDHCKDISVLCEEHLLLCVVKPQVVQISTGLSKRSRPAPPQYWSCSTSYL